MQEQTTKELFISYSWDSEEHKDWVLKLATDLIKHGVEVTLDQWDVRLGDDLPRFMEQGLSKSKMVLCVCSNNYVEKANNQTKGGVCYEKRIISSDMLNGDNVGSIIPIIKNNTLDNKVPTFLKAINYLDFDKEEYNDAYLKLIERIYDQDLKKKPSLGKSPFLVSDVSNRISINLNIQKVNYSSSNTKGRIKFDYKRNDGHFVIGSGDYLFDTKWSECNYHRIYCYSDFVYRIGYKAGCTEFPSADQLPLFDFSSRVKALTEGEVVILENKNNKFAAVKIINVLKNEFDINHSLEFEYRIYDIV